MEIGDEAPAGMPGAPPLQVSALAGNSRRGSMMLPAKQAANLRLTHLQMQLGEISNAKPKTLKMIADLFQAADESLLGLDLSALASTRGHQWHDF
jgi:hypothetical protein